MSIDMMTPCEAAGRSGEITKRWKSYKLIAIKNRLMGLDIAENGLHLPDCQRLTEGRSPKGPKGDPLTGIRFKG